MELKNNQYICGGDNIYFPAIVEDVKKSPRMLQPIYEAFTNALESLEDDLSNSCKQIIVKLYKNGLLEEEQEFHKLIIYDNGTGFDPDNFERFCRFKDNRKGHHNQGCGRAQYLHYFVSTYFKSIYHNDNKLFCRKFELSKKDIFRDNNAIVYHAETSEVSGDELTPHTEVSFSNLITNKDKNYYNNLSGKRLKKELIKHYIGYFCTNINKLPIIEIIEYHNKNEFFREAITTDDIPKMDKSEDFEINYVKYSANAKSLNRIDGKTEKFTLTSFQIPKSDLPENIGYLASKNELSKKFDISTLPKNAQFDGKRYLFLLSGDYIQELDGNTRGEFEITTREKFLKDHSMFDSDEVIVMDDISEEVNSSICKNYPQFTEKQNAFQNDLHKLKDMFLLDKEALNNSKISINDTPQKILEKVYKYDADVVAKGDAKIKYMLDHITQLDPKCETYQDDLVQQASELVEAIPLQNRTALSHYVARRKLVLELFDSLLEKELQLAKNSKEHINESILHNLIFTQHSRNPLQSDLWLINEEFIHFSGASESKLKDVTINGKIVFKDEFSLHEEEYLNSLGEKRLEKRPDVLLFPEEGKCIILEFKAPKVNISNHLTQINQYATWIYNFSADEFAFNQFYGYLIGESLEELDVRGADGEFVVAKKFDYLFRPFKRIISYTSNNDASLYTEAIKYSTLLERAKIRNKIFIDKLMNNKSDSK